MRTESSNKQNLGSVLNRMASIFRNGHKEKSTGAPQNEGDWATDDDIKKLNLCPTKGQDAGSSCYLGGYEDGKGHLQYLKHSGPEHILAFVPCRSGSTLNVVLPNLLGGWRDSVVVNDISGGLYRLSAGYRGSIGNNVLKFSPASGLDDAEGCHFNPLEEVRVGTPFDVKDAMKIAAMIVDLDGKDLNDHWQKTGFAFLVAVILHVVYSEKDKTLHGVARYVEAMPNMKSAFDKMLSVEHDPDGQFHWKNSRGEPVKVHPLISQVAKEMSYKQANESSGVLSTVNCFLAPYLDPIVSHWTAYSDFHIIDLQDGETPLSLFLVSPYEDAHCAKPLTRLVLNLMASKLSAADRIIDNDSQQKRVGKHNLLLLLDALPSLGKIEWLQNAIASLPNYGVKLFLVVENKTQIDGVSGARGIIDNCPVKIVYPPNDDATAEWVSKVLTKGVLSPDAVLRVRGTICGAGGSPINGDALIFVAEFAPIFGKQIVFSGDPVLLKRSQMPTHPQQDSTIKG